MNPQLQQGCASRHHPVLLLVLLLVLLAATCTNALLPARRPNPLSQLPLQQARGAAAAPVESLSLAVLKDVSLDAQYLSSSIKLWLDKEYIVQPIHDKIGVMCGKIYVETRARGVEDLGEMLMDTGTALERMPFENAFVNCWDVANKVADLLMLRMEMELCACAGDMSAFVDAKTEGKAKTGGGSKSPPSAITAAVLEETIASLSSEFSRYTFLQRLLDMEVGLEAVAPVAAVCLGYRVSSSPAGTPAAGQQGQGQGRVVQIPELAAYGWENLASIPDFSDLSDRRLRQRIESDLPEDSGGVDVALEAVIGMESYKALLASEDADVQRRVVITKWLYVQNFFGEFPRTARFVPGHLLGRDE